MVRLEVLYWTNVPGVKSIFQFHHGPIGRLPITAIQAAKTISIPPWSDWKMMDNEDLINPEVISIPDRKSVV